jgi:hypothetical protein
MMSGRQKDATPDMWSGVTSIIDCKEINMAFTILPENPSFANAINNAVANITSPAASMTSKEIADMVGSRHDKTKQSIERLANQGVIVLPPMGDVPFVDESGRNRTTSAYIFSGEQGKRDSIVVVAQLSPQFTAALVDRWQELELQVRGVVRPQQPQALLPEQRGESIINVFMRVAATCQVPMSYALQVAGSEATAVTGMPFDVLLNQSEAMNDVPESDMLLEPTQMAEYLGLGKGNAAGAKLNKMMAALGYQYKSGEFWIPTDTGKPHCISHNYSKNGHKGTNLKWKVPFVKEVLQGAGMVAA